MSQREMMTARDSNGRIYGAGARVDDDGRACAVASVAGVVTEFPAMVDAYRFLRSHGCTEALANELTENAGADAASGEGR